MAPASREIYAATYSNVPVFEFNFGGNHVMRRRQDDWINATHILKVAEYDKPARTRILEREVQKGTHEKIQGGYGKYQGTWIPLPAGKDLAQKNGVFEKLQPIFDYVASNITPPPAPKHATNPNRPKVPRVPGGRKAAAAVAKPLPPVNDEYEQFGSQPHDDDSQDAETIASASYIDGDDGYGSHYMTGSRKKRRENQNKADNQHILISDSILDYFMLSSPDEPIKPRPIAPNIPSHFEVNRPIDNDCHFALHWAVAMGDIPIVRRLLELGSDVHVRNRRGETPLIKAVMFTNNFTNDTAQLIVDLLEKSIMEFDHFKASVLHHTMMTTSSRTRRKCAYYYLSVLLEKLRRVCTKQTLEDFLRAQDKAGDTALHIAARHGSKKCVLLLEEYGAQSDIQNHKGETADQVLMKYRLSHQRPISSSPQPMDLDPTTRSSIIKPEKVVTNYRAEPARSFSTSFDGLTQKMGLQLALAIERDFKDKEEMQQECQEAFVKAQRSREQTQQAIQKLTPLEPVAAESELGALGQEYNAELAQYLSFQEQIQHPEIHLTVRSFEQALPQAAHGLPNGTVSGEQAPDEQVHAGLELARQQERRRKLIREVAEAQALAGMGPNGEAMKRLVADTVGVVPDEVAALAPDLLEALEAQKMDYANDMVLAV